MSLEESLITHCSPTLAGLKTANLYRIAPNETTRFLTQLREWGSWFQPRGLKLLPLRRRTQTWLLYVYRPDLLLRDITPPAVRNFLRAEGYESPEDFDGLLRQLTERLRTQTTFPHEIGIFLGYPLEDVVGFIENKGKNYTYAGCWKSYGDPAEAAERFSLYRACTTDYCRRFACGTGLKQLITA